MENTVKKSHIGRYINGDAAGNVLNQSGYLRLVLHILLIIIPLTFIVSCASTEDYVVIRLDSAGREISLRSQHYNNEGVSAYKARRYGDALKNYNNAIETDPVFVDPYYNRGLVYMDLKEFDKAISDFTTALNLYPNYHKAYKFRAGAYFYLKQFKKAIADYTEAIRNFPEAELYYWRGISYCSTGQHNSGISDIKKAQEMDPGKNYSLAIKYCR